MLIRITLFAICSIVLLRTSVPAFSFELIRKEEAALPDNPFRGMRGPLAGPVIKFYGAHRTRSPFDLTVELIPRVKVASINLGSLEVWYRKDPMVNLKDRIATFIVQKERTVVIRIKGAEAPVGKHQIVFQVEDTEEQFAIEAFDIEIVPNQ